MSKKPCALLINDIHISKDNIAEFYKNWDEAIQICKANNISEMIVGGDLWLSRSAQTLSTLMAVRSAILKAQDGLTLIIAEGNHDLVNQEEMEGYSHIFSDYENVEIVDEFVGYDYGDNLTLWVMSYFPENGSFIKRLNTLKQEIDKDRINILYIHEGIRGGLSTPSDDELPANIFGGFDKVLVGHYHDRRTIPNTSIEYIGASRQHNFGEDEEKGYTILYSDGTTEFIKNQVNTRYKVIDIELAQMDDIFIAELKEIKSDPRYKVKLRIRCAANETSAINKQALAEQGANKIELVTEQTEVLHADHKSITQKFDKSGIKEEYVNFCIQKSIDNQLGLHYLEKLN